MSIQFSAAGPAFPEALVDALLSGDVVFLCGAGISAPQLPDFGKLVKQCFERLHVEMSPSEGNSFEAMRFEEALGSLSRRIVDPDEMTKAIVHLLRPPATPNLDNHRTVLRLSRDQENRPLIVTTNFDTLIEQALLELEPNHVVRALSSAGQDLPAPGSSEFRGIIHLHGRLPATDIELLQTPLVVTSADYGDAYMRSGWASRFLFDLCRCKTVVLIGYRAGDAPVRYFLNLLEADRQRFPELRDVYAFDAVDVGDRQSAQVRWGALAVEPIAYEYEMDASGKKGHTALWRDLAQLADLAERPQLTRRLWAKEMLSKPFAESDATETDRVAWLLRGTRDLWPVVLSSIEDPAWLNFFEEQKLWAAADAGWVVANWISRDFQSATRLSAAIKWLERLGEPLAEAIAVQLRRAERLPPLWQRAWRLITTAAVPQMAGSFDKSYMIEQSLKSAVLLHADLSKAVDLLTPRLVIEPRLSEMYGNPASERVERLADLFWPRLHLRDLGGAPSLLEALAAVPQPRVIMALATARLQDVVQLSIDIEAIEDDYDSNDFAVPSIESHPQNAHHDGPVFLVQLLSKLIGDTTDNDRAYVRALAEIWRVLPGVLGVRLWLHALRQNHLFTADEAMKGAEHLSMNEFWTVRRELALLLKERAADADSATVARIEERILTQGMDYYSQYSIDEGQTDWREHARDAAVWLRLNMLDDAGRLTALGAAELDAIKQRQIHLNRDVEDSDFFGSYSSGVRMVQGDASPILDAPVENRLTVAQETVRSPDIEKHQGWSAYCRLDPLGAFDTLATAPLEEANALLWEGLIGSLCFPDVAPDAARQELVQQIFGALEPAADPLLSIVARRLVDLYWSTPRRDNPIVAAWWPRLFDMVVRDDQPLKSAHGLYSQAINSAGGRLTQAALLDIEAGLEANKEIDPRWIAAIETAATATGRQGIYSRAALVYASSFIVAIKAQKVVQVMSETLGEDSVEAMALRSILVVDAPLSAAASKAFQPHILRGVVEIGKGRDGAQAAAAKIIKPALSIIRKEHDASHWGISLRDTELCLRNAPPSLREGAALLLRNWIHQLDESPARAWRDCIRPLMDEVWPRERILSGAGQASHLAELAIASQEAFPEALEYLLPYLSSGSAKVNIHQLEQSKLPEDFPKETLILLGRIFGMGTQPEIYGIATILDRLIKAHPQLEFDRRLQRLNQRAMRFD